MKRVRLAAASRCRWGVIGICVAALMLGGLEATPPPSANKTAAKPSADDLYEGPAASRRKPAKANLPARPDAPVQPPKYADAWPSEYRVAEQDLGLTSEAENRAQAAAEFLKAERAEQRGDADEALEAWKRAASLDPANADLAVKVAFELAKRNEPGEAIRILKDTIAAAPQEAAPLVYLSQIYARNLNKPDLAIAAAKKALEVAPEDFTAYAGLHELHTLAGEKKKADEVLDRALKSTSKKAAFWLQLGTFLRKAAMREDNILAPEEVKKAETAYRNAAKLQPDDAATLTEVGDFFTIAREHKTALDFYTRAVKLNQPVTTAATRNLREKHIRSLLANDRKAEAIPLLEQLVKDPTLAVRPDLPEYLAELYLQTGQGAKAIDLYKQALQLDPSDVSKHMRLAIAQRRAKAYDDSLATLIAARKRFPDLPQLTYLYADTLSTAKRHDEALKFFALIREEAKGRNEEMIDADFYFNWGAAAERAGKLEEAVVHLKKSIELAPDDPQAYNYLGYTWVDKGINLEEAGVLIKKAVELQPNNGAYLDSLGWYYYRIGRFEDAKRELLRALENLEEEDPVVLDHLGDTYDKLGNTREALKHWERALMLEPDDAEKIRAKIDAAKKPKP